MIKKAAAKASKKQKKKLNKRNIIRNKAKRQEQAEQDFAVKHSDIAPNADDETKKEHGQEESYLEEEDSADEDARIQAMKDAIVYEEKRRFKILSRNYSQGKEVDTSLGKCCCKVKNEKGAKCVKALDLVFLPNLPRWIFALWATIDEEKFSLYARMRLISCWLFWVIGILCIILLASLEVATNDEIETMFIIETLLVTIGMVVCAICDYHFTRVIIYYSKGHEARKER